MSKQLLKFVENFLTSESSAEIFADEYMKLWKKERDSGVTLVDKSQLSEILSSVFCMADMFNPDADRESYEFDETKLRAEITKMINGPLSKGL